MMDGVDKLRELPVYGALSISGDLNATNQLMVCATKEEVLEIADEIEAKIAERYMELPVDPEGVPIHCGDRMRLDNGHEGEVWLIGAFDIMMSDHTCFDWAKSRHVKPRTLEDVLHDVMQFGHDDNTVGECADGVIAKYAAEIRELLGGDAE